MGNPRDLMNHGRNAGKGDADRSPGWRDGYNDINWPKSNEGFTSTGFGRQRKVYGRKEKVAEQPTV